MRYPPEHKAAARAKIIEAGGALAKKSGFGNTGMDALATAAGVTTGALYSQFKSKKDLLDAIIEHELSRTLANFRDKSDKDIRKILDNYLSPRHVLHPEKGCPIPALGPEIARADDDTRALFEELLVSLVDTMEEGAGGRHEAWALLAKAVGGVVLARAVLDGEVRDEILAGARAGD